MRVTATKDAILNRLMYRVTKTEGCWLWNGAVGPGGYGAITAMGKVWRTHRLSWTLLKGDIPEGKQVLHHCDVKLCVRPEHLFLGTNQDNIDDYWSKNGSVVGERTGFALAVFRVTFRSCKLHIPGNEPQRYDTWREAMRGCAAYYHAKRLEYEIAGVCV